jgi:peptide/nickel transport system permease protein
MLRFIVRRLLQAALMVFVLSIGFFLLIHAVPGGPDAALGAANPRITLEQRQNLRKKYHLDDPLPVQYTSWLTNALHGDFGNSIGFGRPVTTEIGDRLPTTLKLFLTALSFSLIVAIVLGVLAAVKQYSITDYSITVLSYTGISMPAFWFALVLQVIFGDQLKWLPVYGIQSLGLPDNTSQFDYFLDTAKHLILPSIVLSLLFIAAWSRFLRSSMLDVVKQDYIRTARAKGLSSGTVFFRHALRNALIPLVTVVALSFGGIVGGAVITEQVFAIAGMGSLFFTALNLPDYPILLAYLVLGSTSVILFNLIADVLYAVIDPRIRYS